MRTVIGVIGRLVFWAAFLWAIVSAILTSIRLGEYGMIVVEVIAAPLTYFVYPWSVGLFWVPLVGLVGYVLSTWVGHFRPIGS